MSNSHSEKYFSNLLIGFSALLGFSLITFYAIFEAKKDTDWYFWAIAAAFLLCGGVYFCLIAVIHKVKSYFNRRAKQREQQKTFTADM